MLRSVVDADADRLDAWLLLASLLVEGRRHFRSRRQRAEAVLLLSRAREIDPRNFETSFELAGLLARTGARRRAQRMLQELSTWTSGRQLRRVRRRQLA